MLHLIGLIAPQLPFAFAVLTLNSRFLGTAVTFLAYGGLRGPPQNLKNI
ncbi:MAG: hypothetical protein U0S50_03450 [Sphingopyxis sp.]|nr:hypothetical protein [Sphingopyxis sp.]MDZ3830859.1 hypothetical protein [Sphingopyxis sp.]